MPLDESLAEATIDLVRRPYVKISLLLKPEAESIEDMPKEDVEHFFQSLLENIASCIHLEVRYGQNDHHKAEAAIKSVAVALPACRCNRYKAGQAPHQAQRALCEMTRVAIFDYGAGNIFSLKNSLCREGATVDIITDFDNNNNKSGIYDGLLFPGCGKL